MLFLSNRLLRALGLVLSLTLVASCCAQEHPASERPALAAVAIENLRCEYLTNPLGLDQTEPRLSWTLRAPARGWVQSAYQIQVASQAALLGQNAPDLWDSGRVMSSQTLAVRYAGGALGSGARAFWRVRVWDRDGHPSNYSAPQTFGITLLDAPAWKARWIGAPTAPVTRLDGLVLPAPAFFRAGFDLNKPVARATLFATARGVYEMHLNGARVGDQVLAPGWTDYHRRIPIQAYDVTAQLREGANALGAVLGDGWYRGYVGYGGQRDNYGDNTALRAQLEIAFSDGTRQTVGTDTSWQTGFGPLIYSDLLMGELFDARKTEANWDAPDFNSHAPGWTSALDRTVETQKTFLDVTAPVRAALKNGALSIVAGNHIAGDPIYGSVKSLQVFYTLDGVAGTRSAEEGQTLQLPAPGQSGQLQIVNAVYGAPAPARDPAQLVGTRAPAVRVTQELKPVKMTPRAAGTWIFDLGQNMVGVARLRVRGAAGTRIQLRYAEVLGPGGDIYTANLRAARATDTYICAGTGEEQWQPRFTFHGFRFVEVRGLPDAPDADTITGLVIGSDIAQTGTFRCSSELVNQLQSNIDWSQRGNFLSVPTDCPQRDERLGWMGDAQVFARTATYNRDVAAFFDKWLQDVDDAQNRDGGFSNVAPRLVDQGNGAPGWGDAGVIVPWQMYQAYGDAQFIEDRWPAMTAWMDYLRGGSYGGLRLKLRGNDFGDWLNVGADTPKDVLATAYYAYDAALMAQMARATGRAKEASQYLKLFEQIKRAFNREFVARDGRVKGETQTAYLLALQFDLLPQELRPLAAAHLAHDIAARGDHLSTGFIGVSYACPTLTATGYNALAYRLLEQDSFPSWGFSIRLGATTTWERWDGWTPDRGFQSAGMNSFNHYSFGSVGQWLFGDVAGIATEPEHPGYERIVIAPHPDGALSFVDARYDSVRGRIESHWKREAGVLTLEVSIPANTFATIRLPAREAGQVRESGQPLREAAGVRVEAGEAGVVCEVGSGEYRFAMPDLGLEQG